MTDVNSWFKIDVTTWDGARVVDWRPFPLRMMDLFSLINKNFDKQKKRKYSDMLSNFRDGFSNNLVTRDLL